MAELAASIAAAATKIRRIPADASPTKSARTGAKTRRSGRFEFEEDVLAIVRAFFSEKTLQMQGQSRSLFDYSF